MTGPGGFNLLPRSSGVRTHPRNGVGVVCLLGWKPVSISYLDRAESGLAVSCFNAGKKAGGGFQSPTSIERSQDHCDRNIVTRLLCVSSPNPSLFQSPTSIERSQDTRRGLCLCNMLKHLCFNLLPRSSGVRTRPGERRRRNAVENSVSISYLDRAESGLFVEIASLSEQRWSAVSISYLDRAESGPAVSSSGAMMDVSLVSISYLDRAESGREQFPVGSSYLRQ